MLTRGAITFCPIEMVADLQRYGIMLFGGIESTQSSVFP
jgi:hypothetical protein